MFISKPCVRDRWTCLHQYDVADRLDLIESIVCARAKHYSFSPFDWDFDYPRNRYGPDMEIWGTESGWSDGIETALGGKNDVGRLTWLGSQPVLARFPY